MELAEQSNAEPRFVESLLHEGLYYDASRMNRLASYYLSGLRRLKYFVNYDPAEFERLSKWIEKATTLTRLIDLWNEFGDFTEIMIYQARYNRLRDIVFQSQRPRPKEVQNIMKAFYDVFEKHLYEYKLKKKRGELQWVEESRRMSQERMNANMMQQPQRRGMQEIEDEDDEEQEEIEENTGQVQPEIIEDSWEIQEPSLEQSVDYGQQHHGQEGEKAQNLAKNNEGLSSTYWTQKQGELVQKLKELQNEDSNNILLGQEDSDLNPSKW